MSTVIHVGKQRVQTVSTSDGSTLAPGAVAAAASDPSVIDVTVDSATNAVTITGKTAGGTSDVTYSADGYRSVSESISVAQLPFLVVTDGPEQ